MLHIMLFCYLVLYLGKFQQYTRDLYSRLLLKRLFFYFMGQNSCCLNILSIKNVITFNYFFFPRWNLKSYLNKRMDFIPFNFFLKQKYMNNCHLRRKCMFEHFEFYKEKFQFSHTQIIILHDFHLLMANYFGLCT